MSEDKQEDNPNVFTRTPNAEDGLHMGVQVAVNEIGKIRDKSKDEDLKAGEVSTLCTLLRTLSDIKKVHPNLNPDGFNADEFNMWTREKQESFLVRSIKAAGIPMSELTGDPMTPYKKKKMKEAEAKKKMVDDMLKYEGDEF